MPTFERFVLRNNSRGFLETTGRFAILAGLYVVTRALDQRRPGRTGAWLFLGGILLGYAVLTKDVFASCTVLPVPAAVAWRRT